MREVLEPVFDVEGGRQLKMPGSTDCDQSRRTVFDKRGIHLYTYHFHDERM